MKANSLKMLFIFIIHFFLQGDPLDITDKKYADYIKNTKKIDLAAAKQRVKRLAGYYPLKKTRIVVYKSKYLLELYDGKKLLKSYKIGIGQSPTGDKILLGDNKTPEGTYNIVTKNPLTNWYLFIGFNYPNSNDAKKALKDKRITLKQYKRIVGAEKRKAPPPWKTKIGGAVGFHGPYNDDEWTWGCVGMLPADLEEIYVSVKYWTEVKIVP